jgi:hypothetical protein
MRGSGVSVARSTRRDRVRWVKNWADIILPAAARTEAAGVCVSDPLTTLQPWQPNSLFLPAATAAPGLAQAVRAEIE